MATLEEQRRASGEAMVARRGTGAQAAAARQAIGDAMVARRTGQSLVDTLNRVVDTPKRRSPLKTVEPRGSLPTQRGRGDWKEPASSGTGGGIASPLIEADAGTRTYWPSGWLSSDGLFVLPAIKTLDLTDANDAPVQIQLANPGAA